VDVVVERNRIDDNASFMAIVIAVYVCVLLLRCCAVLNVLLTNSLSLLADLVFDL
jgi:hypothetical protein